MIAVEVDTRARPLRSSQNLTQEVTFPLLARALRGAVQEATSDVHLARNPITGRPRARPKSKIPVAGLELRGLVLKLVQRHT